MFGHEDPKYQTGDPARPEDVSASLIISPDTRRENRIPPGQSRTRKWPVLDAFGPPLVDLANWQLNIFGLVEKPLTLTLDQFRSLPRVKVFSDFHCVTSWTRRSLRWSGFRFTDFFERLTCDASSSPSGHGGPGPSAGP